MNPGNGNANKIRPLGLADPAVTVEGESAATTAEVTPEPAPEAETEPEISYNPEEIEGGDEMTGETGDDTPDEPRNV